MEEPMSDNICINPRIYYNTQTLTCDLPERIHPSEPANSIPTAPQLPRPPFPALVPGSPRPLEEFRDRILQMATRGSLTHPPAHNPISPQEFSLLAALPFACGDSKGDGFFKEGDAGEAGSQTGGAGNSPAGPSSGGGGSGGTGTVNSSGDSGVLMAAGGRDGGNPRTAPIPSQPTVHDTALCGNNGTIPDLDDGVGVCANYADHQHELFSWDPEQTGQIQTLLDLGFAPDQVLTSPDGQYYLTHHGDPLADPPAVGGLALVDNRQGTQFQIAFSRIVLDVPAATSSGSTVLQFTPSFPKGIARVGERLFIATSNLVNQPLPVDNYFNPGTVLIYNTATQNWEHYLVTGDFNPTSVGLIDGKVFVVNSGDINPARNPAQLVTTPSSIDVIDPTTLQIEKNISLEMAGDAGPPSGQAMKYPAAGINGEIAVSPDGNTLALPTGDNSGRILLINRQTETVRAIRVAGGEKVLLTALTFNPSQPFLYVADFNDGKLYTVDVTGAQVIGEQVLDTTPTDFSGISDGLWHGGSVFVGVGPKIYRLPITQ